MNRKALRPVHAAKLLGSNTDSVRIRMQKNCFDPPIGTAHRNGGSCRFTYEIYPERLAIYLGITVDEVFRRLNEEVNCLCDDT